jgi:hypothetical protein
MSRSISLVAITVLVYCVVAATVRADAPFPAHRVAGNTYYVGSREPASYLITTPEGHFLINSSFEETVPLIRGAVESLGFKMSDVKYLLASHAHADHVAGHARMRELTGAGVLVMEGDEKVIAEGGAGRRKLAAEQTGPSDDRQAAEQLKKAGAGVVLTNGLVTGVTVNDLSKFTDADFETLGRLANLKTLSTSGEALDDRTLAYLTGLESLEDLSTNMAQFSDEGLRQLSLLTNLKQIKFFHTSLRRKDFTGRGLAHLASLKKLRRLTVAGCPFNDEGMAAVGKLTQLENFRTWHTYQTEAGNASLKSLVNLRSLHLGQRLRRYGGASNAHSLTNRTLDVVAELKSLDTLTLAEQKFSVDSLSKLIALPKLKQLDLTQVDIPAADIDHVRAELPGVKVSWNPVTAEERAKLDRLLAP